MKSRERFVLDSKHRRSRSRPTVYEWALCLVTNVRLAAGDPYVEDQHQGVNNTLTLYF